jgi:hypothetical protein
VSHPEDVPSAPPRSFSPPLSSRCANLVRTALAAAPSCNTTTVQSDELASMVNFVCTGPSDEVVSDFGALANAALGQI